MQLCDSWKLAAAASPTNVAHVEGTETMSKLTFDVIGLAGCGIDFNTVIGAYNKVYATFEGMFGM